MTLTLIIIAAFSNAFMDTVENENFYESIFRDFDERFWYKRTSWKYAKKFFGWKLDAWHIAKSIMIISLVGCIVSYKKIITPFVDFFVLGFLWNVLFNLFYNKLFKR